ncbi:MAG: type II secretion system minor pseudopilin GspK [Nitrospirae bacterium]|nr:type II secretion system minor pseudopilin GspK [Nitrospirota bacterium]
MHIRNNKGIALVITLLVLTLLIVLILEFSQGMRVEARAAANFRDDVKAYYLARSGVTFAIALLEEDAKTNPKNVDSLNELWAQKLPPIPLGDGFVSVEITDESSKININKLGGESNDKWHDLMRSFLEHFDMKEDIVEAISDWIDTKPAERPNGGAESSYYEGLEEPYEAKNNLLDSLQELRLVKGIDDDIFGKLRNFLTIVHSDPTVISDGKININTASKDVLMALSPNLTGDIANDIIAFRLDNPFKTISSIKEVIGDDSPIFNEISSIIAVNSNFFTITSTGEVNQIRKKINAIIERKSNKTDIIYWRVE